MRRRRTPSAVRLLLALSVLLGGCRVERTPRPESIDVDAIARDVIRATFESYRQALLTGDARRAAAAFMPDARLSEPHAPDVVGPRAIAERLDGFFERGEFLDLDVDRDTIDIAGGVAYDLGTYEETVRAEGDEQTVRGRYVIRWRRGAEARWRIDRFLRSPYPTDGSGTAGDDEAT